MKFRLLLIYLLFLSFSSNSQQILLIYLNGVGSAISNITASTLFYPLNFNNGCIKIQTGLATLKQINSGIVYTFPCVETRDYIKLKLFVYPNPTAGDLVLKANLHSNLQRNCSVKIVDELGHIIQYRKCALFDLQQGLKLNLQFAASGTYFLILDGEGVSGFTRVIKVTE